VHALKYFILLNSDARSAHVHQVQCCANRSSSDDGFTFQKCLHLKLLKCQMPWLQMQSVNMHQRSRSIIPAYTWCTRWWTYGHQDHWRAQIASN
jgi:hypothetical protein